MAKQDLEPGVIHFAITLSIGFRSFMYEVISQQQGLWLLRPKDY